MNYPFYIVDVFAIDRYTGNQLAVFPEASQMRDRAMQELAKEINFSETTFITRSADSDNSYDVRIFTPNQELPFAGHPTLGTAYIIRETLMSSSEKERFNQVTLNLKAGKIPVTWETTAKGEEVLWMQQNAPQFGEIVSPDQIAPVLNISEAEIDSNFPIQEVSTGLEFLIVPVKSLATLKKIQVNLEAYYQLIASLQAKSLFVFCPETHSPENDLCARMFSDYLGVPEDPATGSANGCLAAYLVKQNFFSNEENMRQVRVEQGYEINRPSLLLLKTNSDQIQVGGQVKTIAQGHFL
ncbi:phenazine biosynthesis protein PhzF family [Halothece sp. PCC 7418]|uniref:PhzF family phenazine biosynthesis protein n=1 Tax=Halothece sp. (strain PCC 7418) TaxID=65093 RepID=UPI0002A0649B|nr:PhzF family phenazine biosynthesis protein [Halothece sp. PCC 7418]AFZ44866.1 phenazine biosynthesis protein PhzF family [Halothece sp. PCC 7418]